MRMGALRRYAATLGLVLAVGCGGSNPAGSNSSPSASPVSSPSAGLCTTTGAASAEWVGADRAPAAPAIVSASVSGDTLTLTFRQGTPQFQVAEQPDAHFMLDPSGQPITLAGTVGVRIVLRGFRGDVQNYTGPKSLPSSGPLLQQAYELGDSEGVVSWGAGVTSAACTTVTAAGSTLTFRFIPQPAA